VLDLSHFQHLEILVFHNGFEKSLFDWYFDDRERPEITDEDWNQYLLKKQEDNLETNKDHSLEVIKDELVTTDKKMFEDLKKQDEIQGSNEDSNAEAIEREIIRRSETTYIPRVEFTVGIVIYSIIKLIEVLYRNGQ
jgi:hypothetical protein